MKERKLGQTIHHRGLFHKQIIYDDSKLPQLIKDLETGEVTKIAFQRDGKRFLFSNKEGHIVIFNTIGKNRPMTRKEYKEIMQKMVVSAHENQEGNILDELAKLNFAEGFENATYQVLTTISEPHKVSALVINRQMLRYVYTPDDNRILKINKENRKEGYMLDGPKKEEMTKKFTESKVFEKKIAEIAQK